MKKRIFVILAVLTALVFLYGCTTEKEASETIESTQASVVELADATESAMTEVTVAAQFSEERDIPVDTTVPTTVEPEEIVPSQTKPQASEQPSTATEATTEPQPSYVPTETTPANQPHSYETERG